MQIAAPHGLRGFVVIPLRRTSAGPPGAHESGDSFADRSHPGTGRSHGDPRKTSLCWASQEPTKVATVSQIAAPQGRGGLMVIPVRRHSAGPPRSLRKWRQFRRSQPPRDGEASILVPVGRPSVGLPRSPRKLRQLRSWQPTQGASRSRPGVRDPPLRWTFREPTKGATVARPAAPSGSGEI